MKPEEKRKALTVRIPESLYKQFKIKCVTESVDMNTVLAKMIEEYVKENKPRSKK